MLRCSHVGRKRDGETRDNGGSTCKLLWHVPYRLVVGEFRLKELRDVGIPRGVTTAPRFARSLFAPFVRSEHFRDTSKLPFLHVYVIRRDDCDSSDVSRDGSGRNPERYGRGIKIDRRILDFYRISWLAARLAPWRWCKTWGQCDVSRSLRDRSNEYVVLVVDRTRNRDWTALCGYS